MDITFRDLQPGDAGWVLDRHGALYAHHEGYDASFEALVAEILADFLRNRDPGCERAWIAHAGTTRLGCVFVVRGSAPGVAKLRMFLIDPAARGQGLGARMLAQAMDWARAHHYSAMELWTHESHRAACALDEKTGWHMVRSEATRAFGVDAVDQFWEIML
jgi:GNAT superfamily N-acetyltransferase